MATPTYYRPFLLQDSELSDSDSTGSAYSSPPLSPKPNNADPDISPEVLQLEKTQANFAALARGLSSLPTGETAGPSFVSLDQEIAYGTNNLGRNVTYGTVNFKDISGAPVKIETKEETTVVVLQSRDRDKRVFAQPTNCQLFLPRVYKNIQGFSISQINLTSAFFYFREDKENLQIEIQEKDKIYYTLQTINPSISVDSNGNQVPLQIVRSIRPGSYDVNSLLAEIQLQLNRVPLFYDFLNGYDDFKTVFKVQGDFSVNFNFPGDNYYDALKRTFVLNPTKQQITSYYFQNQYANQLTFTEEQLNIAYYYPVLKEVVLDPETDLTTFNFDISGIPPPPENTQADVINWIIYNFEGLNDPIILKLITNPSNVSGKSNRDLLDEYRLLHTFRYSLVNKYNVSVDSKNNRVTIQSSSLNTSLSNLLTNQYNIYFTQELSAQGITLAEYQLKLATLTNTLATLQSMYAYLQSNFQTYFAVPYGTYSIDYYTHADWYINIRDGLNASNVGSVNTPISNNILEQSRKEPPSYWQNMTGLNSVLPGNKVEGAQRNMGSSTDPYPISSNFFYSLANSNIDLDDHFIDLSGNIFTDYRRRAGDILVNVDSSKYTIFKFRSKFRQTLQVETLPRQTKWRYPLWNQCNVVNYPLSNLFDVSYSYITPTENTGLWNKMAYPFVNYSPVYGWTNVAGTTTNFGINFNQSLALWGTNVDSLNASELRGHFYKIQTPYPPSVSSSTPVTYSFNITIGSPDFTTPLTSKLVAFLYHDFGAFIADCSGTRVESPLHYKQTFTIDTTQSSNSISFTSYANQTYYLIVRSADLAFDLTQFRIVPWFTNSTFTTLDQTANFNPSQDPLTNLEYWAVAKNNDSNYLRLPISSNLWNNQSPAIDISNASITFLQPPFIGYDSRSNVSNDMTDYIPFMSNGSVSNIFPNAVTRIDPFNNYIFQSNSPYSPTQQSYFYSGSLNSLYTAEYDKSYSWSSTKTQREFKIAQYYGTHFLSIPGSNVDSSYVSPSTSIQPYTKATTSNTAISGYEYDSTTDEIILGQGVRGFLFLPSDGVWALDRFMFKTNFTTNDPAINLNENICALGVYIASEVQNKTESFISLNDAIGVLVPVASNYYTATNQNVGFDPTFGSYYSFSNVPSLVSRTDTNLLGYTQTSKAFIKDINSYYSIIAFTGIDKNLISTAVSTSNFSTVKGLLVNARVTPIQNVTGTPIAYPFATDPTNPSLKNTAYPSLTFYDGLPTPTAKGLVLSTDDGNNDPIYGPGRYGADESISIYEQSLPIVNSHIHYSDQQNIIFDLSGFNHWSNYPISFPTNIVASIPNRMLFQDGNFAISEYYSYTGSTPIDPTKPKRNFINSNVITLTQDQIYPSVENTTLLAVSGTSSNYIFLGSSNNILRFKAYNPSTGLLTEFPTNPNYTLDVNNVLVQHFVINDNGSWALSAYRPLSNTITLLGDTSYSSNVTSMISNVYPSSKWSELQLAPTSSNLYFATSGSSTPQYNSMTLYNFDSTDPIGYFRTGTGYSISFGSSNFKQFAVTNTLAKDEVLLLSPTNPSYFYTIVSYQTGATPSQSNVSLQQSVQEFTDSNINPIEPVRIYGGADGSKWTTFTSNYPYIWGNRNDNFDSPVTLTTAWQIFFPTNKYVLRKLGNSSNPMPDLTSIEYPEWPHTSMFAYSNYSKLLSDISGNTNNGKWGLESSNNFLVSDVDFRGFYFNSYIMNVPLYPNINCNVNDSNNYYYLAVRGYSPTEQFQTMMRFYLPNRYDFGMLQFADISGEVPIAQSNIQDFNPNYYTSLLSFNSNFTFTNRNFSIQGLPGSNISSSNFGQFLVKYKEVYNKYVTDSSIVGTIQSNVQSNIAGFIQNDLKYILPSSALNRQRYTDPLLFRILWGTNLTPIFARLDDEWGLGWNLGYAKQDTGYSTIHTGTSFYKIQQDFIYLRLNQEFNINRMDAGGKENYQQGRSTTGTTNQYYCKLLLTNFGGNSTTFIHNPITFNPPLNRLTKLTFQWVYPNGTIIDNIDAEWNMTVNIRERQEIASIPDKMFFAPADPRTGKPLPLPKDFADPKEQGESAIQQKREKEMMESEKQALVDAALAKERESKSGIRTKK
jgi:hypothetical protein